MLMFLLVSLLLQAGVDINCRDRDGWTPLHACAHWDQMTAAEMLATAGARFDIMTYAVSEWCMWW